jgi:two-component system, NtrC family, sensor kinase
VLSKWPIRNKLLVGIGLLVVMVATLSWSGFHGVYAYRSLVRSLSGRASELPLAGELSKEVTSLRLVVEEIRAAQAVARATASDEPLEAASLDERFTDRMSEMRKTLEKYRAELDSNSRDDSRINDNRGEWQTVYKIDVAVDRIVGVQDVAGWIADAGQVETIRLELERLENLTWDLPDFLHERIHDIAGEVRSQYRGLIILSWITTVLAGVLLAVLIRLFYVWIFHPLRVLVRGSRRVASGEFGYRIALDTKDEMSELAEAMNDMTARFEAIRDGLDRQVQERTKQVVRNEQLASVGFLAAGVAHEINNPLASIALCAESLEGRIRDVLQLAPSTSEGDAEVIRNYLRMIQTEAFRCKGITERLLDFSRMGDVTRQNTDLRQLVQGVIDMVAHLGR